MEDVRRRDEPGGARERRRAVREAETTREVETTARIRGLTDCITESFGLSLFEMDVVVHENRCVIDVNPVVSLHGVEDGAEVYERPIRSRLEP